MRRMLWMLLATVACGDGSPEAVPDGRVADARPADAVPVQAAALDPAFGDKGVVVFAAPAECVGFAIGADDEITVGLSDPTDDRLTLARYTAAGQLDTGFGDGGHRVLDAFGHQLERPLFVPSSSGLLVAARGANAGAERSSLLYRLDPSGAVDPRFGTAGVASLPGVSGLFGIGERDGGGIDLLENGQSSDAAFTMLRLTPSGALDASFGVGGSITPDTGDARPGYFPHAIHVGDGRFIASGAGFAPTNDVGGMGPITAHLFLVADGTVVSMVTTMRSQILDLAGANGDVYVLRNLFDAEHGVVERYGLDLVRDASFGASLDNGFNVIYGAYNGGALGVRAGGGLLVAGEYASSGPTVLDRLAEDGSLGARLDLAPVSADAGFCGLAFDSRGRAVIGDRRRLIRMTF